MPRNAFPTLASAGHWISSYNNEDNGRKYWDDGIEEYRTIWEV
jgi:hypothetical protein